MATTTKPKSKRVVTCTPPAKACSPSAADTQGEPCSEPKPPSMAPSLRRFLAGVQERGEELLEEAYYLERLKAGTLVIGLREALKADDTTTADHCREQLDKMGFEFEGIVRKGVPA